MSASGIFNVEVTTPDGENLWKVSWNTISEFCPTLKAEFDEVLNKSRKFFMIYVTFQASETQQPVVVQNQNPAPVISPATSQVVLETPLIVNPYMNP